MCGEEQVFSAARSWKIFSRWDPIALHKAGPESRPPPSRRLRGGAAPAERGPSAGAATEKADMDDHMMQSMSSSRTLPRPGELSCTPYSVLYVVSHSSDHAPLGTLSSWFSAVL